MLVPFSKKIIKAWLLYDWANSVYSLVITSTLFPIYYQLILPDSTKKYWGLNPDTLYSFSIGISFIIVVLLSPILSSIADLTGKRRFFLKFFSTLGSISCISLFFFVSIATLPIGICMTILASVGFWASLVFYNSYLPIIAPTELHDDLSAKGFSYGYLGGLILLTLCIIFMFSAKSFGITENMALRYCFVAVGIWWFSFSQYSLYYLPKDQRNQEKIPLRIISYSFKTMLNTQKDLFKNKSIKYFLSSFFFYSIGVQTLFYLAVPFGKRELEIPANNLILTILAMQLIAIIGSSLYAKLSNKKGNKFALQVAIIIWFLACILGAMIDKDSDFAQISFYLLAGIIALVMGGIQSLSRATYSKLIHDKQETITLCFSYFDVIEKLAIVIGTFTVGAFIEQFGQFRLGILALSLFFFISYLLLFRFKMKNQ